MSAIWPLRRVPAHPRGIPATYVPMPAAIDGPADAVGFDRELGGHADGCPHIPRGCSCPHHHEHVGRIVALGHEGAGTVQQWLCAGQQVAPIGVGVIAAVALCGLSHRDGDRILHAVDRSD
jgi:hypothetical protein